MEETDLLLHKTTNPLKDKYNLVYIIFYSLGVVTLLPWNFFITGNAYFQYKLRNTSLPINGNVTDETITPLQHYFLGSLSIAATTIYLLGNAITVVIVKRVSIKIRVTGSLISNLGLMTLTLIFVKVNTDSYQEVFFIIVMVTIIFLCGFSAILNASTLGLASKMPVSYMAALMSGQALGGTFAAVINIITLEVNHSVVDSAFLYFLMAVVIASLTLFGYFFLYYLEFSRYYLINKDNLILEKEFEYNDNGSDNENVAGIPSHVIRGHRVARSKHQIFYVVANIWKWGLSVMLIFTVSFACYPAIAALIQPINKSPWFTRFFAPVIVFLLFNATDLLGRLIAGKTLFIKPNHSTPFLILAVLRVVFIPLLMLCNVHPRKHLPVVFNTDYFPATFIALLGLTNGFINNTCMMNGPQLVHRSEAERAGSLMALFAITGLVIGSSLSILMLDLE